LDPQEFTVKQATSADLIGTRVGHAYLLTGVLGTGGMGNVYRASQETIGRDVAIKFLPVEIATDATAVQRLGREAKALGQLNHPGIVTTFDFGFTEKREPYLVLELVEGKSLQTILDQDKRLEMSRALQIFVQICEAMSYAHSQGIVHRDLKPLNIMIGVREQFEFAKILDFGIVKLTSEVQQLTKSGEIWGSPFYMSPEQCTGGTVDNRSDIYSLGVVMFRALTGEVPHRGASFPETIARKLSEYPPSFDSIAPGLNLPQKLEAVVLKCLCKQPDERFNSMQELRAELLKNYPNRLESEATLTYGQVDAVPTSKIKIEVQSEAPAKTRALPQAKKTKSDSGLKQLAIIVSALLVLVGALAAGIFALYQSQQSTAQKPQADINIKSNTTSSGNLSPAIAPATAPAIAPPIITPVATQSTVDQIKETVKAPVKATKKVIKNPIGKPKKNTRKAVSAAPSRPKTLRDILRHTGHEVLQEIRPFRRARQNDPNSFYRDFGGR
jgi:serine/threonine-protein kinase